MTSINYSDKNVEIQGKQPLSYDKLLIASGVRNKIPPIKGLSQVSYHSLRNKQDYLEINKALREPGVKNVTIIGGGFIGMEIASSIRLGLKDLNVTVLEGQSTPLRHVLGDKVGKVLQNLSEKNGVKIVTNAKITEIQGSGKVEGVSLDGKNIPTDVLIIATGVEPALDFVSGIDRVEGGLKTDVFLQTNQPDVYAAGDIAQFPSYITEARERIEHWAVAQQQGRVAALNMVEKRNNYFDIPFFWSNQFINVSCAGFTNGHDWTFTETKDEDTPMKTARITYFYKGEACIGAAAVNWPGAIIRLKIALRKGLMPSKKDLTSKKANYATIAERVNKSNRCCGGCGKR